MKRWVYYIRKRLVPVSVASLAAYAFLHGEAYAGGLIGNTVGTVNNTVKNITTPVVQIVQPPITNLVTPKGGVPKIPTIPNLSNLGSLISPSAVQGNSIVGTTTNINTKLGKLPALDLVGDGLTSIAIDKSLVTKNSKLPGGSVSIPAARFNDVMGKVVNLKGVNEAHTATISKNGVIVLGSGKAAAMDEATLVEANSQNDSIADATLDKANHLNKLFAGEKDSLSRGKFINLFDSALDVKIIGSDN